MLTACLEVLDARFSKYMLGNAHLDRLYTGCR